MTTQVFDNALLPAGILRRLTVDDTCFVSTAPKSGAVQGEDLGGALVVPGFVEGEIHLDTNFWGDAWVPHKPCSAGFDVRKRVAPLARLHALGVEVEVEVEVEVTVASNNILNPFTPFGDANSLRMANLYANLAHLAAPADLEACFDMVSGGGARMIGRPRSLEVGGPADIVLVDAPDPATAVQTLAPARAGWKAGRQSVNRSKGGLLWPGREQNPPSAERFEIDRNPK